MAISLALSWLMEPQRKRRRRGKRLGKRLGPQLGAAAQARRASENRGTGSSDGQCFRFFWTPRENTKFTRTEGACFGGFPVETQGKHHLHLFLPNYYGLPGILCSLGGRDRGFETPSCWTAREKVVSVHMFVLRAWVGLGDSRR